jgi:hypothetical protein
LQHEIIFNSQQQLPLVLIWILFNVFYGVTLAIDLGIVGKIKKTLAKESSQKAVIYARKLLQPIMPWLSLCWCNLLK